MKTLLILIASAFTIFSCKKVKIDKLITESQVEFNAPTTIGTYWIYDNYHVDSNGVETLLSYTDSVCIIGDSIINNLKYTAYEYRSWNNNSPHIDLQRDSSGYRVTERGIILYSNINFSDTIERGPDGFWERRTKMFKDISVTVPAGSFSSIESRRFYYNLNGGSANDCGDQYFILGVWYVKGIGKIKEEVGVVSEMKACRSHLEKRLVNYYIAP